MAEHLYSELKKKEIELVERIIGDLSINLGEIIDSNPAVYEAFASAIKEKLGDGVLENIMENLLGEDFSGYAKIDKIRNYHIFYWGK
jgi:hypothetical protein